jgi:hypothetical protein
MAFSFSLYTLAIAALPVFITLRAIYRLTLHPLAGFPGPKLAAFTSAYQAWYDLRPSTSYIFQFFDLHEEYGTKSEYAFGDEGQR